MTDTSLIGLLGSLALGGTAIYFLVYGMILMGLLAISILIITEIYHSHKDISA